MSRFFSGVRPSRTHVESQYRNAIDLQGAGKHRISVEVLKGIAGHEPQNPKIFNALGIAYDNLRDYDKALMAYEKALELDAGLDYVHNNLGYSKLLQKDYEGAKESFRMAITTAGEYSDVGKYKNNLALAHSKSRAAEEVAPRPAVAEAAVVPENARRAPAVPESTNAVTTYSIEYPTPEMASIADAVPTAAVVIEPAPEATLTAVDLAEDGQPVDLPGISTSNAVEREDLLMVGGVVVDRPASLSSEIEPDIAESADFIGAAEGLN